MGTLYLFSENNTHCIIGYTMIYHGTKWDVESFSKNLDLNFDGKFDIFLPSKRIEGKINIYYDATEPSIIKKTLYGINEEDIIKILDDYDIIITHNESYLKKFPTKCIMFPTGGLWVTERNEIKENSISFMTTRKSMTDGQKLRGEIYQKENELSYKKRFYESKRLPIGNKFQELPDGNKKWLFDSAFSIIVENQKEKNYFSEKIVDCLWSKSIPIYCGCPNINDFFDDRQIIKFGSFDELKTIIKNLSYEDYLSRKQYIEDNSKRCEKYYPFETRLKNDLLQKIKSL